MIRTTGPERRRRRPVVSCTLCRRRKIKCNRESPCSNCLKSRNVNCVYPPPLRQQADVKFSGALGLDPVDDDLHGPELNTALSADRKSNEDICPQFPSSASRSVPRSSKHSRALASQASTSEIESMRSKIRNLEEQLSKVAQQPVQSLHANTNVRFQTSTSQVTGTFHINDDRLVGKAHAVKRSVMHKSRLFGQSHWAHAATLFGDIFEAIEPHVREETSKVASQLKKCKDLARVIKSKRTPPWPTPPTADLPPKGVADELVEGYLRTIETVYRILHIPTFRSDYDSIWASDVKPSTAFLVQLKLVLAIGATALDEEFSMRPYAIRWVYEAHTWLSDPDFKPQLNIQSLQTTILLLIARETINVGKDATWISAGALLRTALFLGLHRDPSRLPYMSIFLAEMRRRLWNSILELTLQSSLISGGSPLISLADFDAEPPGNFDDDQLLAEDPMPKPDNVFTQTSIAIVLRKTVPERLAMLKHMNDFGSYGTYEETLTLDAELRASYKTIYRMMKEYSVGPGSSPSQFQIRMVDFIIHVYLSIVHMRFFAPALREAQYAFSRKVAIESSVKIWCTAYSHSSLMAAQSCAGTAVVEQDDFAHLVSCGSGFFRTAVMLSGLFIAAELRAQLQEESVGPSPYRVDLLAILSDAKLHSWKYIEAGETNIKGYLFTSLICAQIEALIQGLDSDEFPKLLVKAAEDAEERCLTFLEEKASQNSMLDNRDGKTQTSMTMTPSLMEEWDFIMSDGGFNVNGTEQMNWGFQDQTIQGLFAL